MKVAFISNSVFDGAGIAAYRIFKSVINNETQGVFYTNDNNPPPGFSHLKTKKKTGLKGYLWNKYHWRKYHLPALLVNSDFEYFTLQKLAYDTSFADLNYSPDVIHLHWINNILDYGSFFSTVPSHIPIIWTLHDMSPFTGGCIYSWNCDKFVSQCIACPQLPLDKEFGLAWKTQNLKLELFKNKNLHLVANSVWMENEARKSSVFKNAKSLTTIHLSIDTHVFRPVDTTVCREALGLNSNSFVICFGATYLNSRRKGLALLLKALELVYARYKQVTCLVYGSNLKVPQSLDLPPVISVGKIESDNLLRVIFSASDIFVIPSLQEAFGQTCLEAMSCGTPVVGFNVGGIPDMIHPGQTGLLAQTGNIEDLAEKIMWMIQNPAERIRMGTKARDFSIENFSTETQGNKYLDLYHTVLAQNGN